MSAQTCLQWCSGESSLALWTQTPDGDPGGMGGWLPPAAKPLMSPKLQQEPTGTLGTQGTLVHLALSQWESGIYTEFWTLGKKL